MMRFNSEQAPALDTAWYRVVPCMILNSCIEPRKPGKCYPIYDFSLKTRGTIMIIFLCAGLLFSGHGKTKKHPVYWYDKQYDRLHHEW